MQSYTHQSTAFNHPAHRAHTTRERTKRAEACVALGGQLANGTTRGVKGPHMRESGKRSLCKGEGEGEVLHLATNMLTLVLKSISPLADCSRLETRRMTSSIFGSVQCVICVQEGGGARLSQGACACRVEVGWAVWRVGCVQACLRPHLPPQGPKAGPIPSCTLPPQTSTDRLLAACAGRQLLSSCLHNPPPLAGRSRHSSDPLNSGSLISSRIGQGVGQR